MAKIFPTTVKRVIVQQGGGGDVTAERLTYELPETYPTPTDTVSVTASVAESHPVPIEEGILAVLLQASESHAVPMDTITLAVQVLTEQHRAATDAVSVVASVQESHKAPYDEVTGLVAIMNESSPCPNEDVSGSQVNFQIVESHKAATDTVSAAVVVQENSPSASDTVVLVVQVLTEQHKTPTDDISGSQAVFQINESHPVATDSLQVTAQVLTESCPAATQTNYAQATGTTWPNALEGTPSVAGTGGSWTNTGGMIDKSTTTGASFNVTSGGLGGLTSQSANGTLNASAVAPALTDLTITSVVLEWGWASTRTGVAVGDNVVSANMLYSLNDGGSFTQFVGKSATNATLWNETGSLDITSLVAGSWTAIDQFRVRCFANITSGAGVLAATVRTVTFNYARLVITAEKTY